MLVTDKPSTPGWDFYNQQIACLEAHDIDGLMDQYHDDAVLISFDFIIRGSEAIRQHMEGYLQRAGQSEAPVHGQVHGDDGFYLLRGDDSHEPG